MHTKPKYDRARKSPFLAFLAAFIVAILQFAPWVNYSHVKPGESLDLNLTVTNTDPALTSLFLTKQIFNPDNELIIEEEENIAVGLGETKLATTLEIPLDLAEGQYQLVSTAINNGNQQFRSDFIFVVDKGYLYFSPSNLLLYLLILIGILSFLFGRKKRKEKRENLRKMRRR